jgi:hypothetical protein
MSANQVGIGGGEWLEKGAQPLDFGGLASWPNRSATCELMRHDACCVRKRGAQAEIAAGSLERSARGTGRGAPSPDHTGRRGRVSSVRRRVAAMHLHGAAFANVCERPLQHPRRCRGVALSRAAHHHRRRRVCVHGVRGGLSQSPMALAVQRAGMTWRRPVRSSVS